MTRKQDVARAVGSFLGVQERPNWFSGGSKVTAYFQRDIGPVLGVAEYGPDKVQHMRAILESVAVPWSTTRHSSDEADYPGGNVTRAAYVDLLEALHAAANDDGSLERDTSPAEFVRRSIRLRRGQAAFRDALLDAYEGSCAVTRSTARPVLEAAHIIPFSEGGPMHPSNGLLLRTDIHTLFDLRLVAIDTGNWTMLVDESLWTTDYRDMHGLVIASPRHHWATPDPCALDVHRQLSGL